MYLRRIVALLNADGSAMARLREWFNAPARSCSMCYRCVVGYGVVVAGGLNAAGAESGDDALK